MADVELLEPVSEHSVIEAERQVTLVEEGGAPQLRHGTTNETIELSAAAAELWKRLDGSEPLGVIADDLGHPLLDVIELVRRLRANGLAGDADDEAGA